MLILKALLIIAVVLIIGLIMAIFEPDSEIEKKEKTK